VNNPAVSIISIDCLPSTRHLDKINEYLVEVTQTASRVPLRQQSERLVRCEDHSWVVPISGSDYVNVSLELSRPLQGSRALDVSQANPPRTSHALQSLGGH
jgi:hypothetical protein